MELGDPTLDLHGQRVAAALSRVDAFVRQHHSGGDFHVRIVTGEGTGAVKKAVRDLLGRHPCVARWEPGFRNDGVTIVTLAARASPERRRRASAR